MRRFRLLTLAALILALAAWSRSARPADDPKPDPRPFSERTGEAKAKLIKEGGGTADSEKAVALGLEWLAGQQEKDGSWAFDAGKFKQEKAASTGLALLAFLGAGETNKDAKGAKGKHTAVVKNGVQWLTKAVTPNGKNAGQFAGVLEAQMYSQGIATLALAEAYGVTKDPAIKPAAQSAVNYIQKTQAKDGGWGYVAGNTGDTSLTGWQVQALSAGKRAGLTVDDNAFKKASKFLDAMAVGAKKSAFSYSARNNSDPERRGEPGTGTTASGLWTRAGIDGWGPEHPGIADGIAGLMKKPPAGKGELKNLYYSYYATLVLHRCGGDDWATWNEGPKDADGARKGGMRDWLVEQQVKDGANAGSWNAETGYFGSGGGGRLGTTAVCVLHLEVYYRSAAAEKKNPDPKK